MLDYLSISQQIADQIRKTLIDRLRQTGYIGESILNPSDLKSVHHIDLITANIAQQYLSKLPCNVFVESVDDFNNKESEFSVYIDPVDGSLNWERGIGDPNITIAISNKPIIETLNDLDFAYVLGLRSGDVYYTFEGKAIYINGLTGHKTSIQSVATQSLSDAIAYLRTGYGLARAQMATSFPLFFHVRDIRAVDNTGIEFCEIARNAADLLVEARDGSDFFNLLAYPILHAAGGVLLDLQGNDLTKISMDFKKTYNYIACNNNQLAREAVDIMQKFDPQTFLQEVDRLFE